MKLDNRIFLGDCVAGMEAAPAESVQLVVADPPYNIGYDYDVYDDRKSRDEYLEWSKAWIAAATRLLRPDGALWIAMGDEHVAEIKQIGDACGLRLRNWVVWYYTFGVRCSHKFSRSHTHFLYFVKDETAHRFRPEEILVPSARQLVYGDKRANAAGKTPDNTWILRPHDAADGFHPIDDTWYYARVAGTFKERAGFHGCQLPEQLLGRIIKSCSDAGDLVLDPFVGSGSTLVVAKKLGRHWCGWEISESYVAQVEARLRQVQPGDPLEGPEDPLTSAPTTARGRSLKRQEAIDDLTITEAFRATHDGYSVDRLLADPVLNARFVEACRKEGLTGRPAQWNARLIALRKTGGLLELKAERRTEIPRDQLDPFLDAAEIALRRMLDVGYSGLDAILCDPWSASQFDYIASTIAPGFTAFQYRWAALHLRKEAAQRRPLARQALAEIERFEFVEPVPIDRLDLPQLGSIGLVYELIANRSQSVYVGETCHGRNRLGRLLDRIDSLDAHIARRGPWLVRYMELDPSPMRTALQSLWIARCDPRPRLNYDELAAEPIEAMECTQHHE